MEKSLEVKPFWGRPTFLVVTGASQGIGRNLAIEFSRLLHSKSTLLLIARSLPNLQDTKEKILDINPTLDVKVLSIDLSKPDSKSYSDILTSAVNGQYELYFLINNAASIISDIPASKMDDVITLNEYMSLNLYSVTILTSVFLNLFPAGERCIINISSLLSTQPMKGLAFYCIGKASRDMYFKVLAEENPSVNVLNYAPGPIETDMLRQISENCCDTEVKNQFQESIKTKSLVKMEDTIQKLIKILSKRCYKSGAHVDYYDDI